MRHLTSNSIVRTARRIAPAILVLAIGMSGCSPATAPTVPGESTLDRIRREGVIRVGYANEAPYAYMDTASNRLTGEAPEILRVVMKQLGVAKVEGVLTEFGSLIPGLKARRFDIIAAGMYITPERCDQIAFSNPSYVIGEAFVVPKGNPLGLHSFEDVAKHGTAKLGVMAGAVEHGYARRIGVPEERIVVFPDNISGLDGVRAGRADAFAATSLTVHDMLAKASDDRVERADPFTDPIIDGVSVKGYGAFGFHIEDAELRDAFNSELATFIGSPEHRELVAPFGFTEVNLPKDVTAAELCGR